MASYNRIALIGNLTRDPEIRYVQGGAKAVTKFSLAVNRRSKAGDETMFIDVVAWDRLGEVCNQYLRKGASVLIEGRLSIRSYEDKQGEKRKAIEVIATEMQMLGAKNGGAGENGGTRDPAPAGQRAASAPAATADEYGDDEIPF